MTWTPDGDPHAFEEALRSRRLRARDLYLERKLEEGHYAILERRIDELSGQARLSSLGEGFEFMPIGLAKTLRECCAMGASAVGNARIFWVQSRRTPS